MTVLHLSGKPINWFDPPKATARVKWHKKSMYGKDVTGSLRTIAHLDRLNTLSKKRFGVEIVVIQTAYNKGVAASAGTHDYDCVMDLYIPGVNWWAQQRFFRRNGFGCWYRHAPLFSNHIHGFTLPVPKGQYRGDDFRTKVGIYVPGQLIDYYNEAFGLSGQHTPHSDKTWFPDNKDATVFDLQEYMKNRRRLARKREHKKHKK